MHKSIKSEEAQQEYFDSVYQRYREAAKAADEHPFYFRIGGFTVCIRFAGTKMIPIMTPALMHLAIPPTDDVNLNLCVWDSESTGVAGVSHPVGIEDFTDRGDIWGFYSPRFKTAFHWSDFSIDILDLEQGIGVYWVETTSRFPYWVFSSPLRTLFHWFFESKGMQLLHAAAIGTDDGAVILPGKGGMGKSTTAISSLLNGLNYLSDDYVLTSIDPEPMVYSLYNTAKINAEDLERYPELNPLVMNIERLSHEKAVIYLWPHFRGQIKDCMPLKAIMLPSVHAGAESFMSEVGFWKLQRAFAFTTLSQLPNVGRHTQDYIIRLIERLPAFTLNCGHIFSSIPQAIRAYLTTPSSYKSLDTTRRDKEHTGLPLISVIIPVFNGEKYIRDAIENLVAQNYPALEIIIINDGSTDDTDGVVKRAEKELNLDFRYFWYGNDGPAFARNRGIRDASGEFIAFLDADDLYPQDNLHLLAGYLQNHPEADVVRGYGQLVRIDSDTGENIPYGDPHESFPAYIGAAMYRKEVFRKTGLFDASMHFGEDSDWYMRATELGINVQWLDKVTLLVRRHGDNMTEGKDLLELNTLLVFKKALDRMRRGEAAY